MKGIKLLNEWLNENKSEDHLYQVLSNFFKDWKRNPKSAERKYKVVDEFGKKPSEGYKEIDSNERNVDYIFTFQYDRKEYLVSITYDSSYERGRKVQSRTYDLPDVYDNADTSIDVQGIYIITEDHEDPEIRDTEFTWKDSKGKTLIEFSSSFLSYYIH